MEPGRDGDASVPMCFLSADDPHNKRAIAQMREHESVL